MTGRRLEARRSGHCRCLTSAVANAPVYRLEIQPSESNGLKAPSQIMIDKILAIPREKCGKTIARIGEAELIALDRLLAVVIGLADRP